MREDHFPENGADPKGSTNRLPKFGSTQTTTQTVTETLYYLEIKISGLGDDVIGSTRSGRPPRLASIKATYPFKFLAMTAP